MNFDFGAFAKQENKVEELAEIKQSIEKKDKKTKPKDIEVFTSEKGPEVVEVVEEIDMSNMTMDQKLDMWIEQYKNEPKVVYSDTKVLCLYDDKIEELTIRNKVSDEEYKIGNAKDKFEDIVYNSTTRADRETKIVDMVQEIYGLDIRKNMAVAMEIVDPPIEYVEEEEIVEVEEDSFVLPEIEI